MNRFQAYRSNVMRVVAILLAVSGLLGVNRVLPDISANTNPPAFQDAQSLGMTPGEDVESQKLIVSPEATTHLGSVCINNFVSRLAIIPEANPPAGSFTNRVYTLNPGGASSSTVTVIDGNTRTVLANIPISTGSFDIAFNGDTVNPKVLVTTGNSLIHVIDCVSNTFERSVTITGGPALHGFITGSGGGMYIAGFTKVYRVNIPSTGTTGSIDQTLPSNGNLGIALFGTMDGRTGKIYVSDHSAGGAIRVINADGMLDGNPITVGGAPHKPVIVPNTNKLYVGNQSESIDRFHVINLATNQAVGVQLGNPPGAPAALSVTADTLTNRVYVTNTTFGGGVKLWVFQSNLGDDTVLSVQNVPPACPNTGSAAKEVAVNPMNRYVYVANLGNNSVAIFQDVPRFYPCASTSGKTITVTGTGFSSATQVFFGGSRLIPSADVTFVDSETLQVVVPPSGINNANINGYLTIRTNGIDVTTQLLAQNAPNPGDPNGAFPEFVLWGDANGDGLAAQANDLTLARAFLQFQTTPTPRQMLAVDVVPANPNCSRGNGQLTTTDFTFLRAVSLAQADFACTGFTAGTCGCELTK